MGILSRIEKEFDLFLEKEWISLLMAFFGTIGLFLYMALWFTIFLFYLPLNWLWVHRIKEVDN